MERFVESSKSQICSSYLQRCNDENILPNYTRDRQCVSICYQIGKGLSNIRTCHPHSFLGNQFSNELKERFFHVSQCDLYALAAPGQPVYWTGYLSVRQIPSSNSPEDCHTKGRRGSTLRIRLDTTPYTRACVGDPHQFAL